MYLDVNPIIFYIFILYSVTYLITNTNGKNEFLIILIIFIYLQEQSVWKISIKELFTSPIVIRPSDLVLIILSINILKKFISNNFRELFKNKGVILFFSFNILILLLSLIKYGYASIAEFRSKYFFIIIMLYVITNVKQNEINSIIKKIYTYLVPLILLLPLHLFLNKNFSFTLENRVLSAFFYNTISFGFLSYFLYSKYYNQKFSYVIFAVFLISSLYLSHRSVWGMLIIIIALMVLYRDIKISKIFILIPLILIIYFYFIQKNYLFFLERLQGLTSIENDPTGKWRLIVWDVIMKEASFFGKGLGARFIIWNDELGGNITYGTHNFYMTFLYYSGYLGLVVFILFQLYLLVKFFIWDKKLKNLTHQFIIRLSFYSLIGSMIYFIAYESDLISWIFVSFGIVTISNFLKYDKNNKIISFN